MRKTKIICTIGPAVDNDESIRALIRGGMNGARFNFSHGTHESHRATFDRLDRARRELGIPVAAILDTKGPEIRVKKFADGGVELVKDAEFILCAEDVEGSAERVSVTYPNLAAELQVGNRILLDDGLIELTVIGFSGTETICRVVTGGYLSNNKSVTIPDVHIALPAVTERDAADLRLGAELGFDWVAASFIRNAEDVASVRRVLIESGAPDIRIIAKVENREGLNNLEEILDSADAVMVARGDLGVEIPACEVPVAQKRMVEGAVKRGKPVIIATQMLDSIIRNPRPTRAEVSDVANAIFEDASCVMLSGETASGKYPFEALGTMVETIEAAEASVLLWDRFRRRVYSGNDSINEAITHACCTTAQDLAASAIATMTLSGHTARMIARFRPGCPILAITPNERVQRQLSICWGIQSFPSKHTENTDELLQRAADVARESGAATMGDTVVITAGIPLGETPSTNLIKAQVI